MNAKNADELVAQPDVDGGLIGGAALKAPDFAAIVKRLLNKSETELAADVPLV